MTIGAHDLRFFNLGEWGAVRREKVRSWRMHFLVLIPSIRQRLPGFDEVMGRIHSSLSLPTELHVLDGNSGKAQTLNRALSEVVPSSDCDVVVTLDDDTIPALGWQDALAAGFRAMPRVGILSVWLGDEPGRLAYMNAEANVLPLETIHGIRVHRVREGQIIPGALLAMRKAVAVAIGPTPTGRERYQYYEDAFRCVRAWKLGHALAYVEMDNPPAIVRYDDPESYRAMKAADIASARSHLAVYMNVEVQERRNSLAKRLADRSRAFGRSVDRMSRRRVSGIVP